MPVLRIVALLLVLSTAACARREPPAPPLPPSQGWVELTLEDDEVPADPISLGGGGPALPPPCHVEVDLGGRTVLSSVLQPSGQSPPFSVASTFRFAAPAGEHATTLTYVGCRTFGDQLDSLEVELRIPVRSGQVTHLRFDGSTLEARTPPGPIE
jgi:hypothetical protein